MPNHLHGIIVLKSDDVFPRTGESPRTGGSVLPPDIAPGHINLNIELLPDDSQTRPYTLDHPDHPDGPYGLPEIIRAFKSFSARRINGLHHTLGVPVWQRNYYEHIIRSQDEWKRIRDYILTNPINWGTDEEHTSNVL